ncbi:MAG: hypothetical protein EOP84_20075 [Verrucomicrobiaceae bacterium]|nr:MAG: hypothetical protein EOP84_20075 [Verrucomicrobiaceae bacterium]
MCSPSRMPFRRLLYLCTLLSLAVLPIFHGTAQVVSSPGNPPIPIRFKLEKPGYVTLAIDDSEGKRVRNLLSETHFPAGEHLVPWDGLDDRGRAPEINKDGIFFIPRSPVTPGRYTVCGLVRDALDLRFDIAPYTNGNPPWTSPDKASDWLSNHAPPSAVLFVPPGEAPDRAGYPAPEGQILAGSSSGCRCGPWHAYQEVQALAPGIGFKHIKLDRLFSQEIHRFFQ